MSDDLTVGRVTLSQDVYGDAQRAVRSAIPKIREASMAATEPKKLSVSSIYFDPGANAYKVILSDGSHLVGVQHVAVCAGAVDQADVKMSVRLGPSE